jgi:hypothetical protein
MKGLLLTLGLVFGSVALLHADDKKKKGATESPCCTRSQRDSLDHLYR